MHPLKAICLLAWLALLGFQLSLLLPGLGVSYYWSLPLIAALLIPIRGLVTGKLHTYRWIGFMTLAYFCIGISELVANPALRAYGIGTTMTSVLLFLSAIYYARRMASHSRR